MDFTTDSIPETAQSLGFHSYKGNGKWLYDVKAESAALNTTGGRVWGAATRLATYLEKDWDRLFPCRPDGSCFGRPPLPPPSPDSNPRPRGLRILELGAGLGWLGMTVARNRPLEIETVFLTEQKSGGAVKWLQHNIDLNKSLPGVSCVHGLDCDWMDFDSNGPVDEYQRRVGAHRDSPEHNKDLGHGLEPDLDRILGPRSEPWDVVFGSDLVYNADGARLLPKVFKAIGWGGGRGEVGDGKCDEELCKAEVEGMTNNGVIRSNGKGNSRPSRYPIVLYAHTKHRFDVFDLDLFEAFENCGLDIREVHEEGVDTPPQSPPPLTSLFPEMRVAIYRITRKEDGV